MSAVIDVQHLNKRYGDRVAIEDVSFSVAEGEVFGLLGGAGAGKTTMLECLAGLRGRDSGTITVLGRDPRRERAEITRRLGRRLADAGSLDRPQVAEALALYASFYRDPADWWSLMDAVRLTGTAGDRTGDRTGDLGPRLAAALAEVGKPQVAVFDDLTTGLDAEAREQTWAMVDSVRDSGTTVLLATTCLDEAERLCDRVVLIDRGRVTMTGSPAALALMASDT
jgi:ABC-2 type transport system ATP-binding protein